MGRGITVETNDPRRPRIFLTVRALVLGSVELLPGTTMAMTNRRPEMRVGRILVRQDPTEPGELRLTDVSTTADWLVAEATRLTERRPTEGRMGPGRPGDWLVEVEIGDNHPYGRAAETLRFKTGLPREPEVEVAITLDLQAPVTLSRNEVVLQRPDSTETVLISIRRDLDVDQLEVEAHPSAVQAQLERSGRHYKMHVSWDARDAGAEGSITLRVGSESVQLPVRRAFKAAAAAGS